MHTKLIASALLVSASAFTFAVAGTTPAPAATDPVLATFDDGPSGFRFAWTRDAGWTFVGNTPTSAAALKTSLAVSTADDDQPLAAFTDAETGFRFVWNRDAGWTFVGKADETGLLKQAAAQ